MSGINVIDRDGSIQEFPEATTWHIDERGQLHINRHDHQVASFAKDFWQGVSTATVAAPPAFLGKGSGRDE